MKAQSPSAMGARRVRHRLAKRVFAWRLAAARRPLLRWQRLEGPVSGFTGVTIITVAFNNADVIDAQCLLLKRWLADPFRHVVVDNSPDRNARRRIRAACHAHDAEYVRAPNNPYTGRDPSFSHAEALNYAVRNLPAIDSGAAVGFLDHDIFPTGPISILAVLGKHHAYGRHQPMGDDWYLWPGLLFIRCDSTDVRVLDFSPDRGRGDTGALLAPLLMSWPADMVAFSLEARATTRISGHDYTYEMHDSWAHATSASGWRGSDDPRIHVATALARELCRLPT